MTYPQYQDPNQQFAQPQYAPPVQQGQFVQAQYPAPATFPGYAPQPQFAQQVSGPASAQPTARASSLADFWDQRSSGEGKSLKFPNGALGTSYTFMVTRSLTKGDVSQQTDVNGVPQFTRDGSPKWVLVVPGVLPDGTEITWWAKGQAKTALQAALETAGVAEIEAKSILTVTYVKDRPNGPGFSATKIFSVVYHRPQGAAPLIATTAPGGTSPKFDQAEVNANIVAAPVQQAPAAQPAPVAAPVVPPEDPAALFQSLLNS